MLFTQVILAVTDSKRITRDGWKDKRHYVLLKDYLLSLHKSGEAEEDTHPWTISEEDLVAADWGVL